MGGGGRQHLRRQKEGTGRWWRVDARDALAMALLTAPSTGLARNIMPIKPNWYFKTVGK